MSLDRTAQSAALIVLATLQAIMLLALFTKTPPHPPLEVAPFALGPFLAVAIATAAVWCRSQGGGLWLSLLAVALALVSYGPQKYLDPAFPRIWPAVVTAQAACAVAIAGAVGELIVRTRRARSATRSSS